MTIPELFKSAKLTDAEVAVTCMASIYSVRNWRRGVAVPHHVHRPVLARLAKVKITEIEWERKEAGNGTGHNK